MMSVDDQAGTVTKEERREICLFFACIQYVLAI